MLKFEYCKPAAAKAVPTGCDWIHEIKYDGYRGRIIRDGKTVRLLSKSGLDWAWRFPWIVETALKIKQQQFIIDGEICVLDVQGMSDFDALHSNKSNEEAQLYAFDLVSIAGEDLRDMPLLDRNSRLEKLLRGRAQGIFVAPFERGEIGPELFTAACRMRLEGIVSKHQHRRYRARTCDWIKVKNRQHPAFARVMDSSDEACTSQIIYTILADDVPVAAIESTCAEARELLKERWFLTELRSRSTANQSASL